MSLFTELVNNPKPTTHSIEDAFDGNLCRCTGYRPILDGAKQFACTDDCNSCPSADGCDKVHDIEEVGVEKQNVSLFPLALKQYFAGISQPESFIFQSGLNKWAHPSSVDELLEIMSEFPKAKIINGNTEGTSVLR
jgi:xanthine dehydrogenase/oxidase